MMSQLFPHSSSKAYLRRCFCLVFDTLLMLPCVAQTVRFEVGGGLAKHYGPSKVIGAYKIGVAYEHEFDQHWTIVPGLFFYGKGWKEPNQTVPIVTIDDQPVYEPDGVTPRTGIKSVANEANYLTLPILFNYYLRTAERHYIVFGAGPYVGYGLFGNRKIKGDTSLPGQQKYLYITRTFKTEGAKRFDAGIVLRCGYQFGNGFIAGIESDLSLLKTSTTGGRNMSALITLTYRLNP